MLKSSAKALAALLLTVVCAKLWATGYFEPVTWLQDGGQEVIQAPEFFWEIECKRIAKEFVPPEKRVVPPRSENYDPDPAESLQKLTAQKDVEDFTVAVKSGYVKAANADAAIKSHTEARGLIEGTKTETKPLPALPAEADGEFADYHKGALAFHASVFPDAKAAWETLLKRPAAERKYRSTWAAYMLGKLALQDGDNTGAVNYFQMTRQLAKDGFADSLGLAAASYGWEASAEQTQGHKEKAARLFLTQLGAGDVSAVASLAGVIPQLPTPNPDAPPPTDPAAVEAAKASQKEIEEDIKDPILRRLVTCSVLSSIEKEYPGQSDGTDTSLHTLWLGMMEKAGVKDSVDAENIGWVAYVAGKYDEAARWLKLSSGKTPAAHWLKAKLALRQGNTAEAAAALSEAVHGLQDQEELDNTLRDAPAQLPYQSTRGDLGTVLLSRGDFIQALDTFLQADLSLDADYVAERCLTTKELLDYATQHFGAEKMAALDAKQDTNDDESNARTEFHQFRDLVAHRLVREDHYKEARPWFLPEMQAVLDDYTAALTKGNNEKTPKQERARALFHAAWIARYQGMELMGTEAGPDNASGGGEIYGATDIAMERLTGKPHPIEDRDKDEEPPKPVSLALPVSAAEKARLAASKVNPELRYHYRSVAAGLAWKAAALLPDNADETVDVLNTAGSWLKDKHEKQADRFYQAIERRCPKTEIGKEAVKKHWFVDQNGPWSDEEAALDKAKEEAAQKKAEAEAAKSAKDGRAK